MFKNLSTNQVSLFICLAISIINIVILSLLSYQGWVEVYKWGYVLFFLSVVISSFFIVKLLLGNFVYRKIKLIYKIIRKYKIDKDQKLSDINVGITSNYHLDQVKSEVVNWAKDTQTELRDLQELEQYRRNYVGNLSHELKTPIFAAEGFIHTLLDGGLDDEDINRTYLQRAINNINRIKNIVEDLEIINKLELGNNKLDITRFDIKRLVSTVFHNLEVLAKEKRITLAFEDPTNRAFYVNADKENIRHVIENLLTNAIKYGKEEGQIIVSFHSLEQSLLTEISDDGIGISEEHLKHVFDRFYRVDPSRARNRGGSGLGLSIVKHIIEAHGETINVRSTPGVGSTFGFTLNQNDA